MSVFEVILIIEELLRWLTVILVIMLLALLLHVILRPWQPKQVKPKEEGEQGNGSM